MENLSKDDQLKMLERMKANNYIVREETIKSGVPVKRRSHLLQRNSLWNFIKAWTETMFSILIFPITFLFICILFPCVRLCACSCNSIVRMAYCYSKSKFSHPFIEKMSGVEFFWLAPNSSDGQSKRNVRVCTNTVVVITTQANTKSDKKIDTSHLEKFKEILITRVINLKSEKTGNHMFPRFTMRLKNFPFGKMWLKVKNFNIDDHVFKLTDDVKSASELISIASDLATEPFDKSKPRWKVYFIHNYPPKINTIIFSCDPAMADGVFLLHILQNALIDPMPLGFGRKNFGASNQDIDTARSIVGGFSWFFRNCVTFKDKNKLFVKTYEESEDSSESSEKDDKKKFASNIDQSSAFVGSVFNNANNFNEESKQQFLVYGPISIQPFLTFRDVTRATLDELILTLLTSSLREYFQHIHGFSNPYDIAANVSVALQNVSPSKREPYNPAIIKGSNLNAKTTEDGDNLYPNNLNKSNEKKEEAILMENYYETNEGSSTNFDCNDYESIDCEPSASTPFSHRLLNSYPASNKFSNASELSPRNKSKRKKVSPIKKNTSFPFQVTEQNMTNSNEILLDPLQLLTSQDTADTSTTFQTRTSTSAQQLNMHRHDQHHLHRQQIRHPPDELETPITSKGTVVRFRSHSQPNPSFKGLSTRQLNFLRSKRSRHDSDNENNNKEAPEVGGYARTISTPAKLKARPSAIHFTYVGGADSEGFSPTHKTKLSFLKLWLPSSVEGIVPQLWHLKSRFLEAKIEPNHMMFYRCCQILNCILPECISGRIFKRIYGKPTIAYNSCIGPETKMYIGGKAIQNIFFWGPLKNENCLGFSSMTYQSNLTLTLNVNSSVANPELIFDFFIKKLDDLKSLLKNRRVKHQPRFDTIFVPLTGTGKNSRHNWDYLEDETGEKYEYKQIRASRKRSFYGQSTGGGRSSYVTMASLVGPPFKNTNASKE